MCRGKCVPALRCGERLSSPRGHRGEGWRPASAGRGRWPARLGEVTLGAGARCGALRNSLRCAGEGPGRRLEGVEPGALTVRAERGGQGPEVEKEMLRQPGDQRAVGAHKRKLLAIPGKSAPRGIATGGAGDRRCKARPLAEISRPGSEESGLVGVWGGSEGRGLSQAGTLALWARVDPGAREGHLRPTAVTVGASLTPHPLPQISSLGPPARHPEASRAEFTRILEKGPI